MVYHRVHVLDDVLTKIVSLYTLERFIPVMRSVSSLSTQHGVSGEKVSISGGDSIGRCGIKNSL
jgi:hypothetical protein